MKITRKVISAKDSQELKRLYEQHALAAMQASMILGREGPKSPRFNELDKVAGKLGVRSGRYWAILTHIGRD